MPEEEKEKYAELTVDALNTEEGRLRYAGGILMCNALPADVTNKILAMLRSLKSYSSLFCRYGGISTNSKSIFSLLVFL